MYKIGKIIKTLTLFGICGLMSVSTAFGEKYSSPETAAEQTENTTVSVNSIRINNIGATIDVFMTGTPGDTASVSLFAPGTELPTSNSDYNEFMNGVKYANMIIFDETGEFSFSYTAETTGLYTLRTRGALCRYVCGENEVSGEKSEKMYFEGWVNDPTAYVHDDFHALVKLDLKSIKSFGTELMAKSIKSELDSRPEGRKNLFIANDLLPFNWAENYIYWEKGVEITKMYLKAFFDEYYKIGGELDMIFTDAEQAPGMWHLGNVANANGVAIEDMLAAIAADERYAQFKSELVAAGYNTDDDDGVELSSIFKTTVSNNYHYFNNLTQRRTAKYLDEAVYAPAVKHFANVKYSEYGFADSKEWVGVMSNLHKNYLGGNQLKAGTHSSPVVYGGRKYFVARLYDNINGESHALITADTDFGELLGTVINLRTVAESDKDAKIMPWVSVSDNEEFINSGYYYEKIFHVGMHNPDPFMFFGPSSDPTPATAALDELNSLVAYKDRKSLNTEQIVLESDTTPPAGAETPGYWVASKTPIVNAKYVLSGIYAGGRNIWRITPDTEYVSKENFLVSTAPLKFKVDDVTVEFPQGEIINTGDNALGVGYWVTTPEGIMPEVTYDGEKETFAAKIEFRDSDNGAVIENLSKAKNADAVVTYKGMPNGGASFIMAQYKDSALVKLELKKCGVFADKGHAAIFNIGETDTANDIKFFLWDNTMKPLTEVK